MTDIVDRLRDLAAIDNCQTSIEAADEITALPADNERLRAALKSILNYPNIREKIGNQLYDLGCAALGQPAQPQEGGMSNDIAIPPEAVEAAARAMFIEAYRREPDEQTDGARFILVRQFTLAALRAGIAAWPGMFYSPGSQVTRTWFDPGKIILPTPTENTNAEG